MASSAPKTRAVAGRYRAQDLLTVPGLLSLARLPLAVCFPLVVDRPVLAVLVLIAGGLTDVLDGWWARRFGPVTATGTALDPITDKLFVITVAVTLLATRDLTWIAILMLSTRELGELPLVVWYAVSPAARDRRAQHPAANVPGKIATLLQLLSVGSALLDLPGTIAWITATAIAGVIAAVTYWRRALLGARAAPASQDVPGRA